MIRPPSLVNAPETYSRTFLDSLVAELRRYFDRVNSPYQANLTTLNLNISQLPTDAALATLASGDVYRDTTAGNVLKIKP